MDSIKVLVIDDNYDNRTLVALTLKITTNWEVITANDGIEGIATAESERPDVILLDLIMPDIDGLSVYQVLKQNLFTCTIPVIFVTAMVNNQVLNELRNSGANGILPKPLNTLTLARDITRMCDWNSYSNGKKNRLKNCNEIYYNTKNNQSFFVLKTETESSLQYLIV